MLFFQEKSMLINPGLTDSYRNVDRNISLYFMSNTKTHYLQMGGKKKKSVSSLGFIRSLYIMQP